MAKEKKAPAEEMTEEATSSAEQASAKKAKKQPMGMSRRALVIGIGGTVALMGFGALRYVGHTPIPRPPGGQDEAHLVDACIRCEKCYEACPRQVIVPAHIEDGLLGMRSPALNFDNNYCDFCEEENGGTPKCVATCPTGALQLASDATRENTIIGLAVIDQYQCLAYRDTGCHYCVDACPLEAIGYEDNDASEKALRPIVDSTLCNGCGACESVCVSLTAGSIVEGATERAIKVKPLALL